MIRSLFDYFKDDEEDEPWANTYHMAGSQGEWDNFDKARFEDTGVNGLMMRPPEASGGGMSKMGMNALKSGTLGAENEDYWKYQKMAEDNQLGEMISMLGGLQNLNKGAINPRQYEQYQNPFMASLLGRF